MSSPAVLIATAKVKAGHQDAFNAWRVRHDSVIARFPGYVSSDMMPMGEQGSGEWTIVLNFESHKQLAAWQESSERVNLLAEAIPLFESGTFGEAIRTDGPGEQPGTNVTEVILSKIKPGMDEAYRAWAVRIQEAQSKYPGYRGTYLQPPSAKEGRWTTLLRYDTIEHLDAWLAAPERARLLQESKAFIEAEELTRLATAFPGWVPINPLTGKGPPGWKTALLVLLGLFPIVMFEIAFISPHLSVLNSSVATFLTNAFNVTVTSFVTMPFFVRCFTWWFFPEKPSLALEVKGLAILAALFVGEIVVMWRLLPY